MPLRFWQGLAPARWARRASPNSKAIARDCSTSRQAGTAYSGGKPPHSTYAVPSPGFGNAGIHPALTVLAASTNAAVNSTGISSITS